VWGEWPELADSTFLRWCRQAVAQQSAVTEEAFYPTLKRWFSVLVCPRGSRLCVFLRDITARTSLERDLRRRSEELAEAERRTGTLLRQLAREVRLALTPSRNAFSLLSDFDLNRDEHRACALAAQGVRRLGRLLDDLIMLSQLTTTPPSKHRVNLAEVIAQALAETLPSLELGGRALTLRLADEPLWLDADPEQLAQVCQHLLDNAVRRTAPAGAIELISERDGREVVLRVRDDGVGLDEEALSPDRGSSNHEGGPAQAAWVQRVALELVRRLVELHEGSLEAKSAGGSRGCEFIVRLPAGAPGANELFPAVGGRRPRILVVEDHLEAAESLSLLLRHWGGEVRVVHDGAAALEAARCQRPDLALLDADLPDMDGCEVARRLRQLEGGQRLTLVALTAESPQQERGRFSQAGFDFHMAMPVDPGDLKTLVRYAASSADAGAR
jgi:signal transduction histidine kinase